ncbi:MAG TPA: HAMP domain-containing sensor histidine kinase [Thermomicrobiales bacterium]|nr:HAMP domain-containing sensor histidine kinase [Thermomicrobiales bacterium]
MSPHSLLRAGLRLWHGPPTFPRPLQLEWRFVIVRWLGISIMTPGLLLAHLSPQRTLAGYAVLVLAAVYNAIVQVMLLRRPAAFASGYITVIGDALLNIAMINIGGGFNSPFYYLLFTATISAAMRYGYGPSLATVTIFVFLDAVEGRLGRHALDGIFVFRSGFLFITVALAGYLSEQARRAEAALQERLRQADLLNRATATLGASLEFERVLHAVAAAACRLFDGASVVLRPAGDLAGHAGEAPAAIEHPCPDATPAARAGLVALCDRHAGAGRRPRAARERAHLVAREWLPSGEEALVFSLALPTRQAALATLAVGLPADRLVPDLDPDILDSFVERTTLAIENAGLYRTLASRGDDLQRAYSDLALAHQELLGVDEMKTNFLANVSHELRTPLSSIRSFSELLLSYDDDPGVQQEFLGIINQESERLTRLVNDVLDITKIEAGQLHWDVQTLDVAALLRDSARTYAPLIEQQGLAFERQIAAALPPITADRDRLQQVIANLLVNAMKFTPAGTIRLVARRVGDEIHIAVADTGIGIAPEDRERIFEKFQQVGETLTGKPKGTGLGLSICRDIVAHHQGRLWVESRLGVGSTFVVALPALSAATSPPAATAVAYASAER